MGKIVSIFLVLVFLISFIGCGRTKIIDDVEYDTYGFINADDKKNPDIYYEIIWGNVVWSFILIELIVPPIYFLGFSLYKPVALKSDLKVKGQVVRPRKH